MTKLKIFFLSYILASILFVVGDFTSPSTVAGTIALTGCGATPAQVQAVEQGVLTAKQIACIFGSVVVDPAALAEACAIADTALPLLQNLIGQREGARRAGVLWSPSTSADAGPAPIVPKDAGTDARKP